MSEQQNIEQYFRQAFADHEVSVPDGVWTGVQSQIVSVSSASASAAAGSAVLAKAAAMVGAVSLIAMATVSELKYHQTQASQRVVGTEQVDEGTSNPQILNHKQVEEIKVAEERVEDYRIENEDSLKHKVLSENTDTVESSNAVVSAEAIESANERSENEPSNRGQIEITDGREVAEPKQSAANDDKQTENEADEIVADEEADSPVAQPAQSIPNEESTTKTTAYFTHAAEQVITPNGDPFNEYFEVDGNGVKSFHIRIFSRGGSVVYESDNIHFKWNGQDRFGNALPNGVYFYEIQAIGEDDLPYLEPNAKGNITVMR